MYRPFAVLGLVTVACILIIGTFALLLVGRPVPEPIWVAWGVVITALFGHGVFLVQATNHQATVDGLMEAVRAGVAAATPGQPPSANGPSANSTHTTTVTEEVTH